MTPITPMTLRTPPVAGELTDGAVQAKARLGGAFYLLTILTGIFAEAVVSGSLVVGDPATTAQNILAHAGLYRAGFAVYLIEMACNIAMTAYLYEVMRPVSRSLSLLGAWFSIVGIAIKTLSRLFFYAPLLVLGNPRSTSAFTGDQLQSLAHIFLKLNDAGAGMGLVFFGIDAIVKGYLMLRSTFLPRFLGVLSLLGGLGWLTWLSPPFGHRVFPFVALVGLAGSAALILQLLIRGVNVPRWKEMAREARD